MRSFAWMTALLLVTAVSASGDLAVRGTRVHTMAGEVLQDGVVVVRDGKIAAVGPASDIDIPSGIPVRSAEVVIPGLIDAHTVVGLAGYLNQTQDQEQLERSSAMQPELRAIDAYDPRERLIEWVRGFGVTTLHTGHGPGALVSGQTMVVKTAGNTVEDAVVVPFAMVAATVGNGAEVRGGGKSPGTRSKAIAMLRAELIRAGEYRAKVAAAEGDDETEPPARDLRLEALVRVLDGEAPLLVTVHRHHDLVSALRVREEFDIPMVLDGAAEAYLVPDEIRAAGVPVLIHPTMARAWGDRENLGMETASILVRAGIPVAFQSGYESYVPKTRVVLFEGAVAAAHGMTPEQVLEAMTAGAARILGVDDRVGSLEVGKDGDLALYDGDPLEYTTHCVGVVIDGEIVHDEPR